jgi:hypothetical protein
LALLSAPRAGADPAPGRTDVVTLLNGDRITGEVKRLDRGRLEFKTDDVGTLDIEWDNVASVDAARTFEVGTSDGRRFVGTLAAGPPRVLVVVPGADSVLLPMREVTLVTPIGESFVRKLDGTIDAGFSYTRSSGVAQLNVNSETVYRRARFDGRLGMSATLTRQREEGVRDDRGALDAAYVRYLRNPWFGSAGLRFETNESLGIRLRSQAGVAFGPRLVNTNRAQVIVGGGLVLNDERAIDAPPTQNLEAMLLFRAEYFTYDRPKTTLDVKTQYYPSLTDAGRHRLQFDGTAKRELWRDFYLSLNAFDTYDSRPPNPAFDSNDLGIALSVGWSY